MNGRHQTSLGFRKTHRHPFHDSYRRDHKPAGFVRCRCGVGFDGARWVHAGAGFTGEVITCPACLRTQHQDPAGILRLEAVPPSGQPAVLAVLRRAAAAERQAHPLERVMGVREDGDALEVATTGVHCLRRMLAALLRTWRREFVSLPADGRTVRLRWQAQGGVEH